MTDTADGLPVPQRYWAILTIALGLIMAVMDGAIANVALPTIAQDLHASPAFSIWIVNGYQLAITISLLPLASLGEIIGYRRVYLAGLLLFTLASLFCALSHTLVLLTIARVVQGFGAAGIMSVNMALVRFTYPHRMLGRGIGFNALVVAVSAAVGPTLNKRRSECAALPIVARQGVWQPWWPFKRIQPPKLMQAAQIRVPVGVKKEGKGRQFRALGFHSLRHSFVSRLANAEVSADVRKQIVGHSSDEIHQRYVHLELALQKSALSKQASIL